MDTRKIIKFLEKGLKITKGIGFLILLTCSISVTRAQDSALNRAIPPSPEAMSLFKFSQIPVSKFTGLPDVNIPLFTIKGKKVTIPIQLSYHGGGVKVTEVASSVGMGWALSYGGMITQTIMGLADNDINYGRYTKHHNFPMTLCDMEDVLRGYADGEPDVFSFSFLNYSGKFLLDTNGIPILFEDQKLKIEYPSIGTNPLGWLNSWKITDPNGIQYFFTGWEDVVSQSLTVLNNTVQSQRGRSEGSRTWLLNQIVDQPGDTIFFKYDTSSTRDFIFTSESENFATNIYQGLNPACFYTLDATANGLLGLYRHFLQQTVNTSRIKSIIFPEGHIDFISGGQRCDLSGDTFLGKVVEYNLSNKKIKEFDLNYKYAVGNQFLATSTINCSSDVPSTDSSVNNFVKRRLFLTGVDEVDSSNVKIDSYGLEYDDTLGLPQRFSAQQDLWGFYNGNGYSSLLQNLIARRDSLDGMQRHDILGRTPNFVYAKQGTLNKITYPTGGYSKFEYELNTGINSPPLSSPLIHSQLNFSATGTVQTQNLTSFSVNDSYGYAVISFTVGTCTWGASRPSYGAFDIIKASDSSVLISGEDVYAVVSTTGGTVSYRIPNGTYVLQSYAHQFFSCNYSITMNSWTEYPVHSGDYTYGGLRIKSIQTYDPVSGSTLKKQYQYTFPNGHSSMALFSPQNYQVSEITQFAGYNTNNFCEFKYLMLSSSASYPVASNQNGLFGYNYVTEKDIDVTTGLDNGYTVFQYDTLGKDVSYIGSNLYSTFGTIVSGLDYYPKLPTITYPWSRGKPTLEESYRRNSDQTYYCNQRKKYYYSGTSGSKYIGSIYDGFVTAYRIPADGFTSPCYSPSGLQGNETSFSYSFYGVQNYFGYKVLDSVTVEYFDDNSNDFKTFSYFTYDSSNLLPSVIKSGNSKGEYAITNLKYPKDYSITGTPNNNTATGIQYLQNNNFVNPVIEKYIQKSNPDGSNLRTVAAILNTYKTSSPYVDKIFSWEANGGTSFSPTLITSSATTTDVNYQQKIIFDKYDAIGNILQQHKNNDQNISYIWDYNFSYPIAEVSNADSSSVAYTSFEADGSGNWTIPSNTRDTVSYLTGGKSYNLTNGSITKTGVTTGKKYIVSFWIKPGSYSITGGSVIATTGRTVGGWTYKENLVSAASSTITITGMGNIDELRLYPAGALMTSYTYSPLVGMTTMNDPNSEITYYEYDGLQRLKNIKDYQGNILKNYQYNYAQSCTTCNISMQNYAGRPTISYPVGVFSVDNKLIGNATTQAQYDSLWNSNATNHAIGTLSAGSDSMHFSIVLNSGQTNPGFVIGCRYYQYDLSYTQIDAIQNHCGAYVDYGDGSGMFLGKTTGDTSVVKAPNTIANVQYGYGTGTAFVYWIHSYPNSNLKTLTFYHNDDALQSMGLDNANSPATSLTLLANLRGNIPQNTTRFGGDCNQQASVYNTAAITNWNSISNITDWSLYTGDLVNPCMHINYPQDFMANNKNLRSIVTNGRGYYGEGFVDATFKISRLKSDWNKYFTNLTTLEIDDDHWNHEDLTALTHLKTVGICADNQNHTYSSSGNPLVPMTTTVIDNIINQIAAGSGQITKNGLLNILSGGTARTSASNTAVTLLKAAGWSVNVNGVAQ